MAASMSCSALIRSAPSICARRRRERLAATLAPVGPQGPPARRCARLVAVAPRARGSLLWTTGTSVAASRSRRLAQIEGADLTSAEQDIEAAILVGWMQRNAMMGEGEAERERAAA